MSDEIEVPTEHLQEMIHEEAHQRDRFTLGVALSSAVLAVLAALGALFAGHYSMDAMLERIDASNKWSHYQAKAIKRHVIRSKVETLKALGRSAKDDDDSKIMDWQNDQSRLQGEARELTSASTIHLRKHTMLAGCVTFFQVAIALGAIAVLTKKRWLWLISLAVGLCGAVYMTRTLAFPVTAEVFDESNESN